MDTCKTCKHWNRGEGAEHRPWCECKKTLTYMGVPIDLGTFAVVEAKPVPAVGVLRTNEDFGCNQHEPKEEPKQLKDPFAEYARLL